MNREDAERIWHPLCSEPPRNIRPADRCPESIRRRMASQPSGSRGPKT